MTAELVKAATSPAPGAVPPTQLVPVAQVVPTLAQTLCASTGAAADVEVAPAAVEADVDVAIAAVLAFALLAATAAVLPPPLTVVPAEEVLALLAVFVPAGALDKPVAPPPPPDP